MFIVSHLQDYYRVRIWYGCPMRSGGYRLVSVVLPVYRVRYAYLYECIRSILGQTYDDIELIVVVDPSGDRERDSGIAGVIELFRDDHRLRAVYHRSRRGLVHSINEGIVLSRGELIARADADDYYDEHRLEHQVDLISRGYADIAGTWALMVSADGRPIARIRLPVTPEEIREHMIAHNPIINSSTIVAKKVYRSIGLYVPRLEGSEDYEFWIRAIANNYRIANIPKYLTFLRENPESITRGSRWLKNRMLYITLKLHALATYPKTYLNARNTLYTIASTTSIAITPQIAPHIKRILRYTGTKYIVEKTP